MSTFLNSPEISGEKNPGLRSKSDFLGVGSVAGQSQPGSVAGQSQSGSVAGQSRPGSATLVLCDILLMLKVVFVSRH